MGDIGETVSEAVEQGKESRLNSAIALLVAIAATFMALCNVKDGNIVQAMAQAQANAVDTWSYFQSKSTKQALAESMVDQLTVQRDLATAPDVRASLEKRITEYTARVKRYETEKNDIKTKAEGFQKEYDALNVHDDQFDLSDAALSVAIALFGVTALTQKRWLFGLAAIFMLVGVVFGIAGFFRLALHPDAVTSIFS